jgi:hypothetical protein
MSVSMVRRGRGPSRWATLALAVCLAPASALAQGEEPAAATSERPAPVTGSPNPTTVGPATPAPSPAPLDTRPEPKTPQSSPLRIVEWLSPEAYPEPRLRGIRGGSLWLERDFHGLQWPYFPRTGIGFSGVGWVDTGLRRFRVAEGLGPGESKGKQFVQQSRIDLRVTPTWSNGDTFVQLHAELVATQLNASSSGISWTADDAWIRAGRWNRFDVIVGRFEAWEVYHYGMGLDLYTLERNGANGDNLGATPSIYGLTYMFERQNSLGQAGVHVYPTSWLRFELGAHYGPELNGANTVGVRPVAVFDIGWLKVKAGYEVRDQTGQADNSKLETIQEGGAGGVQVVVDPYAEFGLNFGYAHTDSRNEQGQILAKSTFHTYSVGGFANARVAEDVLVGAGVDYTFLEDTNHVDADPNRNDEYDHWQPYGAFQVLLFKQLFVKAVVAYAVANLNPIPTVSAPFKNEMWSGRLRLLYLF